MYITLTPRYVNYLENEDNYIFVPTMWTIVEELKDCQGEWAELTEEGAEWAEDYLYDLSCGYDLCYGRATGKAALYTMSQAWELLTEHEEYCVSLIESA